MQIQVGNKTKVDEGSTAEDDLTVHFRLILTAALSPSDDIKLCSPF